MIKERRRVLYSGRVQGVGFRATTRRVAMGFPVAGYVRNLPEGQVEIVSEGTSEALDAFLGSVHRELNRWIRQVTVLPEPLVEPAFTEFSIRS